MAETAPFTVEQFGGINLLADPFEVGASAARDTSNLRLDAPGKLVTRGGFDTLNSTTQTDVVAFTPAFHRATSLYRYIAVRTTAGGTFRLYDVGLATSTDHTSLSIFGSGTFGTFTGGVLGGFGGWLLARSDDIILTVPLGPGGTLTAPSGVAGSPQAHFLGVTGIEGRGVAAYAQIGGAPLPYRVHFSGPSNLGSWGATDYVDIWKEDDQQIRAVATFRDQVFVFKDRRFAVFYGESPDQDGGVIFAYRPVDVGIGCAYDHGAAVGPDGVYFIATNGIYRTQGDAPTLVSGALQPVFDTATDGDWNGPAGITAPRLLATQDRLYFINAGKVFSYHYASGAWALDSYAPGVQFMAPTTVQKPRAFYFIDGTGKTCEAGDTFADDDGTAIAWSFTSGRYSLADPGDAVITRESSVVGSGTVKLAITTDLYGALYGTTAATLGTAPATAEGWPAGDQEGTWFQHTISGIGPAVVSRITHYVSSMKAASIR